MAAIEEWEEEYSDTGFPSVVDSWQQITDRTFRDAMEALLREDRLVGAIQLYRAKYSSKLRFAKRGVLAWRKELGLDSLAGDSLGEESVETFDIQWRVAFHPQSQFLFWKQAEAFCEIRFDLYVGDRIFEDTFALSWRELAASEAKDGEYGIFTCQCGVMACGGFSAVEVIHLNGLVLWYDSNNRTPWHIFEEANYKAAIRRFDAALLELTQSHPGAPIKLHCDF